MRFSLLTSERITKMFRSSMWDYQFQFLMSQTGTCKILFKLLDEDFTPEVFLVGILTKERNDRSPACVYPEDDFCIHSSAFNMVLKTAEEILQGYPERQLRRNHPLERERQDDDELWRRSVRDAIRQVIENNSNKLQDMVYFVAYPATVEGYLVSVVIGLQQDILKKYSDLTLDSVPLHEFLSIPVAKSLTDAVVESYLNKVYGELQLSEPGYEKSKLNAEEILRDGANRFMMGLAFRVDQGAERRYSFLSSCTNIARTYYEGTEGAGTIVLARKDHPSLEQVIQFQTPSKLWETKASRKLLQLASQDFALHTNSEDLFGLVKKKKFDDQQEELFTINVLGHHHWTVSHNEQILMGVRYGQPYLPKPPFDENKLGKDISVIFKEDITQESIDLIVTLVREAERERHGTMLVISSIAKEEAERLSKGGTRISPKTLTADLLRNLTSIDGAVLLNPEGTCYALGVILDGIATKYESSARGARYNSAIRYIHSSKYPALAVVVSEDGGVDFISNLNFDEHQ